MNQLKRRLKKSDELHRDYLEFMTDIIDNYAELVPECELDLGNGKVNYVPHSCVYHPRKKKIRVVFDCAARYKNVCLNDFLLSGPDQLNQLTGVLCRFRKESVALMTDIKSMFFQFMVDPKHRNLLRFLWWDKNNLDGNIVEYRMKVHLFGAASSPGCATFGLRRAADDGEGKYGFEAADFIRNNFYVDDGLISVPTVQEAVDLVEKTTQLCLEHRLELHKFVSNKPDVLNKIPSEMVSKNVRSLDVFGHLSVERALGISWCLESDTFQFRITLQTKPPTRRGVLSTVSSIFDSLGIISPFVLRGKHILQELCKKKYDWDEELPSEVKMKWERWIQDVKNLNENKVARCLKPEQFGQVEKIEIHNFSDASTIGYGQCSYARFVNSDGNVHCAFLMGKSRVAPLKHHTIPRMELTAALVSARVNKFLVNEMNFENVKEYFWVDSKIVLGYLSNEVKRFHVFVANRIQQIINLSDLESWNYISTEENPSDIASRGCSVKELVSSTWLTGPSFLWQKDISSYMEIEHNLDSALEIELTKDMKKSSVFKTSTERKQLLDISRLDRFSSWYRAKKAVANCLIYLDVLKGNNFRKPTVKDMHNAEMKIIKGLQYRHFEDEIYRLLSTNLDGKHMKRTSKLFRLDPFLDQFGILRVGGRIKKADLSFDLTHPVILPPRDHLVGLLIRHHHISCNHMGRGGTLNAIRQNGIWLIGGTSVVSRYIKSCVSCNKMRGKLCIQKMAEHPLDRVNVEPPFTYCGVDYFGPFYVKERRSVLKKYGVLFTCLSSRAIHLESANSLETDSFINALRRFLARRGPVKVIRSDQGTNLVGAHNELSNALLQMRNSEIGEFLLKKNCDWIEFKHNVPSASHMGGCWERQIRTVRAVLESLLKDCGSQLDDESLRTFLAEAENIVNSRPLSVDNLSDKDSLEPLTPNHILKMKPQVLLAPPGTFVKEDMYLRKRWKRVQFVTNQFWLRWRKEFLHHLQLRNKWTTPQRGLRVGDVVLISDSNLHQREWQLGRIEEVYESKDNLVRKVKVRVASSKLDKRGIRQDSVSFLDRPVHKLVLLLANNDNEEFKTI